MGGARTLFSREQNMILRNFLETTLKIGSLGGQITKIAEKIRKFTLQFFSPGGHMTPDPFISAREYTI